MAGYCRASVSDARKGVKRTIYLFAVLEGGTVMAVELLSARMVAPYFGSSLYVWATVIGFTLLALAIGYFLGGAIADKYSGPDTLLWLLLIASLFLLLMHVTSQCLTIAFENVSPGLAIILVSMALILPPLVFLGMIPTFLIRRVSANADHAGTSTGRVYAISSASGIVALPVFGFFVIPRFGLTLPSIITGLVVGFIPFVKLISQKTFRGAASNGGRSSATPGLARLRGATARQAGARSFNVKKYAAFSFVAVALFSLWAIKTQQPGKAVDVKCYSEGLLGQVLVADVSDAAQKSHERMLMVNRIVQMWMDMKTGKPKWDYIFYDYSVCSKLPEKSDALILGLGGGFLASVFQRRFEFNVDGVELDARIAEVARDYFGLSDKVNVVVDDARHYLEKSNKKYDLILFDVYRGELPPPHVFTLESLSKARELLKENGLILVNFNGYLEGNIGKPARSIYKTLVAAGLEARILPTPGAEAHRNLLFVASKKKQDFHAVRSPLFQHGKPVDIETLFLDPRELHLNDAVVLTDDKPILELLNIAAGNAWRKGYTETTKRFYKEGVPLFR